MNLIDICEQKYPGQIALGNIKFRQEWHDSPIEIAYWNVDGVEKPIESDLINYGTQNERAIGINLLKIECIPLIQKVIDLTANQKQYDNAISCASYKDSTNAQWALDATNFIAWRDAVWMYAFSKLNEYINNQLPLPTSQDIIDGMPPITW